MSFLRFHAFSRLNYLLALILVLPLIACSGGDEDLADAGGDSLQSSTFGALGLAWTSPEFREDGTILISNEISGYRIYYGTAPGDYQNQVDIDSGSNSAQISAIPSGTYYVVVTAIDMDGRESLYSREVVITI
jgi:hypothetical protein